MLGRNLRNLNAVAGLVAVCVATPAIAVEAPPLLQDQPARFELYAGVSDWPALADLKPLGDGRFDAMGLGLGASIHTEFRRFDHSELLLGIDAWIYLNDSDIPGPVNWYSSRHMYFGMSSRWRFGDRRNVLLDAGAGFHLVDLTDVNDVYGTGTGFESWQSTAPGLFVGATWDLPRKDPLKTRGWFVSIRTHFADFGTAHDEGMVAILGPDAGTLTGPVYQLQFGYGGL